MKAVWSVLYREAINCFRDKIRIISSGIMTVVMLLVFSVALGNYDTSALGINKIQFLFPGIIAATISMTAMSNSLTVVTDKSEGFMKEFLVAPISRSSIALGKIFGTSITALLQGMVLFLASLIFGVRYGVINIIGLFANMFMIAFVCSSIGLFVATKVNSQIGYQIVSQAIMTPMVFLSGAYIPINLFPNWLKWIANINPIAYAVNACRIVTYVNDGIDAKVLEQLGLDMKIAEFQVTPIISLIVMLGIGIIFTFLAARSFRTVSAVKKVKLRKVLD